MSDLRREVREWVAYLEEMGVRELSVPTEPRPPRARKPQQTPPEPAESTAARPAEPAPAPGAPPRSQVMTDSELSGSLRGSVDSACFLSYSDMFFP